MTNVTTGTTSAATALVPVFTGTLQGHPALLCDARTLHTFMGVLRDFSNWIKGRIRKFGFVEGVDYLLAKTGEQVPHQGGTRTVVAIDYHLSLDMAKELSMVENNDKGREARRYFLACEKRVLNQIQPVKPLPNVDQALAGANLIAARVQEAVFKQLLEHGEWVHERWLLSFNFSRDGAQPYVHKVGPHDMVVSMAKLAERITEPNGMLPSNAELALLAKACNTRLAQRFPETV